MSDPHSGATIFICREYHMELPHAVPGEYVNAFQTFNFSLNLQVDKLYKHT